VQQKSHNCPWTNNPNKRTTVVRVPSTWSLARSWGLSSPLFPITTPRSTPSWSRAVQGCWTSTVAIPSVEKARSFCPKKHLSNNHFTKFLNFVSSLSATRYSPKSLNSCTLRLKQKPADLFPCWSTLSPSLSPTRLPLNPQNWSIQKKSKSLHLQMQQKWRYTIMHTKIIVEWFPKSFGKIIVPIWTSLNSGVARSWRLLRRADPYADNCPCFSLCTPACPALPKVWLLW
jgi:hypothetical protein